VGSELDVLDVLFDMKEANQIVVGFLRLKARHSEVLFAKAVPELLGSFAGERVRRRKRV
jgi:hypothetical protein